MNRLLVLAALAALPPLLLAACEGEPPVNAPENPSTAPSAAASASATPVAAAAESAPPATAAPACPPPPCAPASASVASAAQPAESLDAGLIPPPSIARGNIVGSLTTKPASLAGQAVVFLEDGPTEDAPSHMQTVTIENRMMNFVPFVSVVAVGGKVVFANADPFPHNVFSPDNEKFNLGNIPQNGAHVRTFKTAGTYSLLCNLHPGMLGYLVVTPSTWFARADGKGNFSMKHVPAGTYKATAWAPRQGPVTVPVTVADGDVR